MQGKCAERDLLLGRLAAEQHGVVAYRQLIELGFTPGAIEHGLRRGRLHPVFRGVYAVGHPRLSPEGRWMGAVLACGDGALLSHWSAAVHWRLLQTARSVIDISVPRRRRGSKAIQVHEVKEIHPADRTIRNGIPVTAVPRTLLDLAAEAPPRRLRRAVNEAERAGWLNRRALEELFERHPRRAGMKALRAALGNIQPSTRRTRSDLEDSFLALCRRERLDSPIVNANVDGFEVDMYWPDARLIVELDSFEYHRTSAAFHEDRRRDAQLKLLGNEVLRVGDEWLDADPAGVAATVRLLLERRR